MPKLNWGFHGERRFCPGESLSSRSNSGPLDSGPGFNHPFPLIFVEQKEGECSLGIRLEEDREDGLQQSLSAA